jgi:hypothetical protein
VKHTWLNALFIGLVCVLLLYCVQAAGLFVNKSYVLAPGVRKLHFDYHLGDW